MNIKIFNKNVLYFAADRAFLSWLVKVPSEAEQMRARQVSSFFFINKTKIMTGKDNFLVENPISNSQ